MAERRAALNLQSTNIKVSNIDELPSVSKLMPGDGAGTLDEDGDRVGRAAGTSMKKDKRESSWSQDLKRKFTQGFGSFVGTFTKSKSKERTE